MKIQLLMKDFYKEIEVDLLKWDEDKSFQTNQKLREFQVKANILGMEQHFKKEIHQNEHHYQVILSFESKMNGQG